MHASVSCRGRRKVVLLATARTCNFHRQRDLGTLVNFFGNSAVIDTLHEDSLSLQVIEVLTIYRV